MTGCIDCGELFKDEGGHPDKYVRRQHKGIKICHPCFIARMRGHTIEATEKDFDAKIDAATDVPV